MVSGTSPRVGVGGIEDRADDVQRLVQLLVRATVEGGAAVGRGRETQQDAQRPRLPGPVGPEEAHHLTGVDLEAQIIDGDEVAEALSEVVQLNYRTASSFVKSRPAIHSHPMNIAAMSLGRPKVLAMLGP